jgi:hypothetical protein
MLPISIYGSVHLTICWEIRRIQQYSLSSQGDGSDNLFGADHQQERLSILKKY